LINLLFIRREGFHLARGKEGIRSSIFILKVQNEHPKSVLLAQLYGRIRALLIWTKYKVSINSKMVG